jgi:hypothetical protein
MVEGTVDGLVIYHAKLCRASEGVTEYGYWLLITDSPSYGSTLPLLSPGYYVFDENSETSGVLIPVKVMMSSGITDVIILPDDATATFFRTTIVSRTMTLTQNCELIIILYFSHLHQLNTSK